MDTGITAVLSSETPVEELFFLVAVEENGDAEDVGRWLAAVEACGAPARTVADLCMLVADEEAWDAAAIPASAKERIEQVILSADSGPAPLAVSSPCEGEVEAEGDAVFLSASEDSPRSAEGAGPAMSPPSPQMSPQTSPQEGGGVVRFGAAVGEVGPTRAPGGTMRAAARKRQSTVNVAASVIALLQQEDEPIDLGDDDGFDEKLIEGIQQMGLKAEAKVQTGEVVVLVENSDDLGAEELEWVLRVLDTAQKKHAAAVARLYVAENGAWKYTGLRGAITLVTESDLQHNCSHALRLVHLDGFNPNKSILFEQPFYEGMDYVEDSPFFHSFEADNCLVGLSFASEAAAGRFHESVQYCMQHAADDVIDELMEAKEKSVMVVGENFTRNADDSLTAKVIQKYAAGGITDGIEVKWKRPEPPKEVMDLLGGPEPDAPKKPKKASTVIDLIAEGDNIQKLDRSATIQLGASSSLFDMGDDRIADGIAISWSKNSKTLTDDGFKEKSRVELKQELTDKLERLKRLEDMLKGAQKNGDPQVHTQLRQQIMVLERQVHDAQVKLGLAPANSPKARKKRKPLAFGRKLFK